MGLADAEAFLVSDTEILIVAAPMIRGVPDIKHSTLPVVGFEELTVADKPEELATEQEY